MMIGPGDVLFSDLSIRLIVLLECAFLAWAFG